MAIRQHQLIALVAGKKKRAEEVTTRVHHGWKPDLLTGFTKTYRPKAEDGDKLPDQNKHVQIKATEGIREVLDVTIEEIDAIADQDETNRHAVGDIVVDGKTLIANVPATHLLFLERKLENLKTFVEKVPTLDPAKEWDYDENTSTYRSKPVETTRTKKVPMAFVRSPATQHHPAQVDRVDEDVIIGYYTETSYSSAMPQERKNEALDNIRKLLEGVKLAREQANSIEVKKLPIGKAVMEYVFGPLTKR